MKTKTLSLIALAALLLSVVATAAIASTSTTSTYQTSAQQSRGPIGQGDRGDHGNRLPSLLACESLKVGETITASGLVGHYVEVGTPSATGTASGTFTFTVQAIYSEGCALSIASGSFTLQPATPSST